MVRKYVKHIALLLCALLFSSVYVDARVFEEGEKLYFNGTPSSASWWMNNTGNPSDGNYTRLWAYFYNGESNKWLEAQRYGSSNNFYVEETATNDWTHVILTRHRGWVNDPRFDGNCLNKTGDISFGTNTGNYIQNFAENKSDANWWIIAPSPSGDPEGWTLPYEDEQICKEAENTLYILAPKNYDYDNSKNHAWFEYSGGSWTRLNGAEFRDNEGLQDYNVTLGAANSDTYYFLQAGKPSACRLIRVRLNQNCSDGAEGACKITSFVAVASDANVTDETCAVNGLVAFDDKVNAGNLKIWCEDVDTVEIPNASIEIPQTFKLKGFDAKIEKTYTLYAKFQDGTSDCEASCLVTVKPPSVHPIIWNNTGTGAVGSHDRDLIRFTCEDVKLTPSNQSSKYFQWTSTDYDTIIGQKPENRNITFPAPTEEKEIEYVFLATQNPPDPAGNLIINGSFEHEGDFESKYDYWGINQSNYYSSHPGASGGYSITPNSQTFSSTYNKVTPHDRNYFGLFDSKATTEVEEQAAWIATTTTNPDLKVQAGVSYLFSFWVANINNFGEMNNGAQLQFQISYDGGGTYHDLGSTIDLGNYRDNRWHGMSSIETPTISSDNVAIRVIDLNASLQNRGNDFALDDIRFEAVTANTSNIAAYERFPVKYIECKITGATFEQPLSCGATVADVNYTITFENPRGDLYIYEGENELARIPHATIGKEATSYTGVLKDQPVDNKKHDLTVYFFDGNDCSYNADNPKQYSYDSHAVPAISVKSISWDSESVTCDNPTVTLTAVINYTNQNGTLTANVDGHAADPAPTYTSVESDTEDQVTLIFPGIAADGRTDHKLNVNFDGSKGCFISDYAITEAAPYMPNITSTKAEIQQYACIDVNYQVTITVTYENPQDHDLIITDEAGHEKVLKATEAEYGTDEASWTFDMPWDDPEPKEHTFKAYFEGADGCKDKPTHLCKYTAPAKPSISAIGSCIDLDCEKTTYTLQLDLTYTNQKGPKFYASVDGGTPFAVTNPNPGAQTEKKDVTLKVTGLLADGKTDHTYRVWTDNTEDCELDITYKAPFAPVISNISATPKQMGCDETEYDVTVTFDVKNGQDSMVTVWCKADKYTSVKAIEGTNTVTFEKVKTDAEKDYFDIWFEGAVNCKDKHHVDYKEPVTPHISVTQGPEVGDMECDKTTYTVKFDIAHTNQSGKLYGWIDDDIANKKEFDYEKNPATVTFTEVPGDGLEHTLHAEFDGENSCSIEIKSFKAPFTPVISDVQIKRSEMKCGETTFNVTVEATLSDNAKGHKLTVTGDTGKGVPITYDITDTKFSEVFTLDRDKATGKFVINFADANNCEPQEHTYDPPKVPGLSVDPVEIPVPKCDQTTFDLTISGSYTYLRGTELHFLWDGVEKAKQTITSLSDVETFSATLKDLAYDGQKHVLTVKSNESTYDICPVELTGIEVPFSPEITKVEAKVLPYVCDAPNYQVTITVTYENPQGHDLIITDEAGHEKTLIATDPEYGTTSASWTFDMPWENPVVEHTFKAYFKGAEGCKDEDSHKGTYTAPKYWSSYTWEDDSSLEETFYICPDGSKYWNGETYSVAGDYEKKLQTVHGCDSIVMLHLLYWPTYTWETDSKLEETFYICPNGSKEWNGKTYTEEGDYELSLKTVHECDSIVMLHLRYYSIPSLEDRTKDDVVFKENLPYIWEGNEYTISGNYEATKTTSDGCVYSVYLHLTVTDKPVENLDPEYMTICPGATIAAWRDLTNLTPTVDNYKFTTTITDEDKNYIATLIVNFYPIPSLIDRTKEDVVFTENLPYIWEGNEYTVSGNYEATKTTEDECEYSVYLHLTVTDKPVENLDPEYMTICPGATIEAWHDLTNLTPTAENNVFTTTIHEADKDYKATLIVNFHPIPSMTERTTEVTVFTENLPYIWEGEEYTVSGNYEATKTTEDECEYSVYLHLTVTDKPVENLDPEYMTICPGATIEAWRDLTNLTPTAENNVFTTTIHEADKDYVATLIVNFHSIPSLIDRTKEDVVFKENLPYIWEGEEYTESGSYQKTVTSADGCTYTIYLNLEVVDKPVENLEPENMTICPGATIDAWRDLTNLTPTAENNIFTTTIHEADKDYKAKLIVDFYPIPSLVDRTTDVVVFTENLPYIWEGEEYTVSGNYEKTKTTDAGCEYSVYLHLTVTNKPVENLEPENMTICPGATIEAWRDLTDLTPTAENNVFTTTIHEADKDYKAKLIVDFYPIPSLVDRTTDAVVFTENLPYIWEGEEYTVSGNYEATKTTDDGCEYSVYLHLTVTEKPVEILDPDHMTICPGTTIDAWHDLTDLTPTAENNVFTTTIHEADKDYKATLIVDFHPIPSITERTKVDAVFTENLPYIWEGNEYNESGNYEATKTTDDGCEYKIYLNLTVSDKIIEILDPDHMTICPGTTIDAWHDLTNLTPTAENNVFTTTIHDIDKDYFATLIVDFHPIPSMTERTTVDAVFTENLPYIWEGNEYNESGNYETTKTTDDGCEYKVYLHLTVTEKPVETLEPPDYMTICPGSTIDAWHDLTNLTPTPENNIFTTTIHEADKDYIAKLIVDFYPIPSLSDRTTDVVVFTDDLPYRWEGQDCMVSDTYEATKTTDDGCEYKIYLNLTVSDKPIEILDPPDYMTICPGATIDTWHDLTDLTPTAENNVFTTTIHEADKDYKATLIVDFYPIPSLIDRTTDVVVFTEDLPYHWEGQDCMVSDTYEATKTTDDGCEYKIYLNLTVTDKPIEILDPDQITICPGTTIDAWHDLTNLTPTAENNVFTTTIHEADKDYKAKLIVDFYPVPTIAEATTNVTVFKDELPYEWNDEWFTTEQTGYTKELTTDDGCKYTATLNLTISNKPVVPLPDVTKTICPGDPVSWDGGTVYPTEEKNEFTRIIEGATENYSEKLIVSFFIVPTITEATTTETVFVEDLPFTWNGEQFYTDQTGYTKELSTDDGCTYTATLNLTIVSDPIVPKPEITATASVMPYACGDHTYSVKVEVEFANGQGRDLIFEDWKGNKRVFPTTPADTKIDDPPVFEYQKYTPGGKHGFKVYFDGYEDCAVYAYYIEPAQPKIDIVHTDIGSVTSCGATYDLYVTFDYYNQDGTLSVDLDGRPADYITPDFVKDEFDKQRATATFSELSADGQKHTLTVQTTGGVHNCLKSVTVDAPQAEDIITSVEVSDVPENIRCDQTEYDVTITVTMSSDNAIGKKIIIAHEGQTDDFIATANPMETTVKMTTADATGLTVDAYFDGHPECKVTSKTFDAPKRLKCIKDYAQTCEGERYTWSVTGLSYGPFAKAGMDTIVNEFNVLDTLIVTVYPTYNMPEEQVTIIDGETYTWNGKDYETEGIYKETLLSEHDCDSIVALNLTVKENIVEEVAFTIAEQCAGEGLLEIAVQHTGLLTDARLTFSPEAVAAGFVNDTYPLDDQDIVSVPYNVKAGIFSVHIDLLFHSRLKHSADEPFTLLFPRTVLEQGWMDAIFVLTHDYNGGYDFTDFQWYKKGQMLVGETGPYLYQPLEVGAEYSAMLTEASGLKLMTCPLIVTEHSEISLYPTVVTRKDLIHVNVSQDARLTLYSIMGERHNSYSLLSGDTRINAPGTQGIYLAEIVLESGQRKVFKIMVR